MSEPGLVIPCRRCAQCRDEQHHWIENDALDDARDPEFICKHCRATCRATEDDEGATLPDRTVRLLVKAALNADEVEALRTAQATVEAAIGLARGNYPGITVNPLSMVVRTHEVWMLAVELLGKLIDEALT